MRITIATGPCLPVPPLRGGGMIRMWMALAAAFVRSGHEVTLVARAYPGQSREETCNGFRILRWGGYDQPRQVLVSLLFDLPYAFGVVRHLPEADILVTNDFWLPVTAPFLAPQAGKVVVSVNRHPKHQLALYARAALLVAPSKAIARAVRIQSGRSDVRIVRIPNPCDERVFHPDPAVIRVPTDILYTGRIHPEKGLELLLRAFRRLHRNNPRTRLTVVGPHAVAEGGGGEAFLQRLRMLAEGLPVHFTGPVHRDTILAELYQSHGVFCYPSLADGGEAMGIAPIEAMASGCVPVVSANPVFQDWLRDGNNGRAFDHHHPQAEAELATCLTDCTTDLELQERMRSSALETAAAYHTGIVAGQFLEAFAPLCHAPR